MLTKYYGLKLIISWFYKERKDRKVNTISVRNPDMILDTYPAVSAEKCFL